MRTGHLSRDAHRPWIVECGGQAQERWKSCRPIWRAAYSSRISGSAIHPYRRPSTDLPAHTQRRNTLPACDGHYPCACLHICAGNPRYKTPTVCRHRWGRTPCRNACMRRAVCCLHFCGSPRWLRGVLFLFCNRPSKPFLCAPPQTLRRIFRRRTPGVHGPRDSGCVQQQRHSCSSSSTTDSQSLSPCWCHSSCGTPQCRNTHK